MNGDAFQRARPGEKLKLSATAWNACLDAAEAHKRGQPGMGGGPIQFRQADIVLVKNASGSDVSRFEVLGIDGVIVTPDDSLIEFQNQVALRGITPDKDDHAGKFVICLDPIADGKIGRAWVSGVCLVQVSIADVNHRFCDVLDADRGKLLSSANGSARILYKQNAELGVAWCVVRMGDGGDSVRIGKVEADWSRGTCATVTIWESGDGCEPTQNAPAETIEDVTNLSQDVLANSWVVIGRGHNSRWYLIEAGFDGECRKTIGGEDITKWPGWNGEVEQILGHDASGCLKWFDIANCSSGGS